jgi:hypothetical protein
MSNPKVKRPYGLDMHAYLTHMYNGMKAIWVRYACISDPKVRRL